MTNRIERNVDVSIVIPALNEGRLLTDSISEIVQVMQQTTYRFELIFVDDGSTDRTPQRIKKWVTRDPRIRALFHECRMGRGQAVVDGIREARGRYVGFLDIDLEVHARYIPTMLLALEHGYDVAIAYRIYKIRLDNLIRVICTKGYRQLVWWALRLPIRDTETGFKFFRRDRILPVLDETKAPGWFWDTEVMAYCAYRGLKITEIPSLFIRRRDKQSSVRVVRDSIDYARSLWRFRRTFAAQTVRPCSPLYRWPVIYHLAMRCLYGWIGYHERFQAIAAMIPSHARVLDLCCGDGLLYEFLRPKHVNYVGVDINAGLLKRGLQRGAGVMLADVRTAPLERFSADYLILQASLYQFIPRHREFLDRLAAAARVAVIIVEPVHNVASSRFSLFATIAKHLTNPGTGPMPFRFTREELEQCLRAWGAQDIRPLGRRELLARRRLVKSVPREQATS